MSPNEEQQVSDEMQPATELEPLPAEQIQLIDALHTRFSEDDTLPSTIETVIREHLRTGITSETLDKILSGLELYLDTDSVIFLLENLRRSNEPAYIESVKAHLSQPFWDWQRYLIALFAADFRKVYTVATENPNAWDILNRHTYYDSLTNMWTIALEIVKYNGERFNLEESPRGAFTLIYGIIDMLMTIPPEEASQLIDKEYLTQINDQFQQLMSLYTPEQAAESAEAAQNTAA